jgi:hypothetical protein
MVIKGMSVEDAMRMIGKKAVDLARDDDKNTDPRTSKDGKNQ